MNWFLGKLSLAPDLSRAIRTSTAFGAALLICLWLGIPAAIPFAATAAQIMGNPQYRGAYGLRLLVLLLMTVVFAGSALLGSVTSSNTFEAVAAIGVLSLLSGFWRHLSADYGQPLTVDSALFFLIALDRGHDWPTSVRITTWVAVGCAGGALLQIGLWFFRPQHSLRHAVSECWIAASDLFSAMKAAAESPSAASASNVTAKQRALREILDRTLATLAAASSRRKSFLTHLEKAQNAPAHFAMQVVAFWEAIQPLLEQPEAAEFSPALAAAMETVSNTARSGAITLITHRQENLATTEVRLDRCQSVLRVLEESLAAAGFDACATEHAQVLLHAVEASLPRLRDALSETVDHSARRSMFPFRLPNLDAHSMRALAAGLNPSPTYDPALIRYSLRMTVLTMLAVFVYRQFHIPRGYWMAFAIVVVLQPDYGATRQRAAQRILGTLAGAVLGSALLYAPLPSWLFASLAVAMVFVFGYLLKRNYGLAVFFITLMLVLVTESLAPVHLDFTIGRLLSNAAGAALAFVAALVFWPSWERQKFPALMAEAIRASGTYLCIVGDRLAAGKTFSGDAVHAKRQAERAANLAAASLQRMLSEPARQQEDTTRGAALVASTQRVINAITVLAVQLGPEMPQDDGRLRRRAEKSCQTLRQLARRLEAGPDETSAEVALAPAAGTSSKEEALPSQVASFSLRKISAEVRALALVVEKQEQPAVKELAG